MEVLFVGTLRPGSWRAMARLYYDVYYAALMNLFLFSSTWLIALVSVERCLAVCCPFRAGIYHCTIQYNTVQYSALTLSVGRQEEHPACKNGVMRCWCGYLSGVRCRLFAYVPADATASLNPVISCFI